MVIHRWTWPVACGLWPVACGLCPRLPHWWWYIGYFIDLFFGRFFFLARNPGPWWSLSLAHWWWYIGYFVGFVTYGQGRWLYVAGLFLIGMGLAFCPSFFELSTSGFFLLPFWVLSFCEVVDGDLEACFCCCATLFLVKSVLLTPRCCFGLYCALLR